MRHDNKSFRGKKLMINWDSYKVYILYRKSLQENKLEKQINSNKTEKFSG